MPNLPCLVAAATIVVVTAEHVEEITRTGSKMQWYYNLYLYLLLYLYLELIQPSFCGHRGIKQGIEDRQKLWATIIWGIFCRILDKNSGFKSSEPVDLVSAFFNAAIKSWLWRSSFVSTVGKSGNYKRWNLMKAHEVWTHSRTIDCVSGVGHQIRNH